MDAINWNLVLSLLTAHILADFLLQTDEDVERKFRPAILLKHAGIVALLSYLLVRRLGQWAVPIVIFASYALIDVVKARSQKKTLATLIGDQLAHILIYLLLFAHKLNIDPVQAAQDKIEKNAQKYPAELVRGKSAKYTEY
jgi:uncharacterized membrane protein YhhN